MTTATSQTADETRLAALIVEALNLEIVPAAVEATARLYPDGHVQKQRTNSPPCRRH